MRQPPRKWQPGSSTMIPGKDRLVQVARIVKSYGTEGDVMISFHESLSGVFKKNEPVILFYDSLPVPFFINSLTFKGPKKAIVHFEDICSAEDAEEAAGKGIYADPGRYPELSGQDGDDGLESIIGFLLVDGQGWHAGIIKDILDFSGNVCLEVGDSATLIPFHEDLLIGIDPEQRTVAMHIEDGLL